MRKSGPQRTATIGRMARKALETPDLPDDLRAKYQAIVDKAEAREILANAQARTLARMQAKAQAEPQDTAPSEPTKETR